MKSHRTDMLVNRRRFIQASGTLALGSGLLFQQACKWIREEPGEQLIVDYVGPDEHFRYLNEFLSDIRQVRAEKRDFEQSLQSTSQLAFVADSFNRTSKAVMLLEQGKDLLLLPPFADGYTGFDIIQGTCNQHGRRLAMLNPFRHYPSFNQARRMIRSQALGRLSNMRIEAGTDWDITQLPAMDIIIGPGMLLFSAAIELCGTFPETVEGYQSLNNEKDSYEQLTLSSRSLLMEFVLSAELSDWRITVTGTEGTLLLAADGSLVMNDQQELVTPEKDPLVKGLKQSAADFIEAVRTRREPASNLAEGLNQVILSKAILRSVETQQPVAVFEQQLFSESDRAWFNNRQQHA